MARYDLNEVLKQREHAEREKKQAARTEEGAVALDDLTRVKALSPGQQVVKRFLRNRLAVFGLVTLIVMFVFSFLVPIVYPYGQTQIFYKYGAQNVDYALAKQNESYTGYVLDEEIPIERNVLNMMNSNIKSMLASGDRERVITGSEGTYRIVTLDADGCVYLLRGMEMEQIASAGTGTVKVGTWNTLSKTMNWDGEEIEGLETQLGPVLTGREGSFTYGGAEYTFTRGQAKSYEISTVVEGVRFEEAFLDTLTASEDADGEDTEEDAEPATDASLDALEQAITDALERGEGFALDGADYILVKNGSSYEVCRAGEEKDARIYTLYTVDTAETGGKVSDEFRIGALLAMETGDDFAADGQTYSMEKNEEGWLIADASGTDYAEFNTFSIRRYTGEDSMEYRLKQALTHTIEEMIANGQKNATLTFELPMQGEDSSYVYDEDGNLQYQETEMRITQRDTGEYVINADQVNYMIDLYASPSRAHVLGTDGDGFDVLARVMYGGRVSLMVGFVVVFLEIILGVIMGGLAGYYGGWVDMLIMRLVDIFYCLPSLAIMIIIGAMMDAMRVAPMRRLVVMMAILGFLGWASVARMVRGQILSLREQEFMTAAEATGLSVRRRIFSHLIPNVMPQLIVIATLGMGSTIITESTLSFLGLGVKYPLATWGTIINSVSSATAMKYYAHIWIPVGLLICLTVIAFNFVGDGLRDAYDPKSKR